MVEVQPPLHTNYLGDVVSQHPEDYRLVYWVSIERYTQSGNWASIGQAKPTSTSNPSVANFGAFPVYTYGYINAYRFVGMVGGCPAAQFPTNSTTDAQCASWAMNAGPGYRHSEPVLCFANPSAGANYCEQIMTNDPITY